MLDSRTYEIKPDEWERKTIVAYGIGHYYDFAKSKVKLKISYLCDRSWEHFGGFYDGLPVISPERLRKMNEAFVLIFAGKECNYRSIKADLDRWGIPCEHADKFFPGKRIVTGKELKERFPDGCYRDECNNNIIFDSTVEDALRVTFVGVENTLVLGRNIGIGSLEVELGNHGSCEIGDDTDIVGAHLFVTDGRLIIGQDCLLSLNIQIRNHDGHQIFDAATGKRINYAKDIVIGNHTWICEGAALLPGFSIGNNSIVGEKAVTSSHFGERVIIAGNPARVIRDNVCWAKDADYFFQKDSISECRDLSALKYWKTD